MTGLIRIKDRAGWLVAALLLLALAACSGRPPALPRLAPDAVILAFGDSLTFGTGAGAQESYPAVLAALSGRRVVNAGVPGEVSAAGLARLPALLEEHRPQLVILCHGGNDLLRRLGEEQLERNLAAMVELARAAGAAVVLVGVPRASLLPGPAELYARLARARRLPYLEEAVSEILRNRDLKSDPIHPNATGYRVLAERLHALLRRAGAV
jgi:lysophospholipase L1-like esterase